MDERRRKNLLYDSLNYGSFRTWRRRLLTKHHYYKNFLIIFEPCLWCTKEGRLVFIYKSGSIRFACANNCGYKATVEKKELTLAERQAINRANRVISNWDKERTEVEEKKTRKHLKETDPCPLCGDDSLKLRQGKLNGKKIGRRYHFCRFIKCSSCDFINLLPETKKYPGQPCECPRTPKYQAYEDSIR